MINNNPIKSRINSDPIKNHPINTNEFVKQMLRLGKPKLPKLWAA